MINFLFFTFWTGRSRHGWMSRLVDEMSGPRGEELGRKALISRRLGVAFGFALVISLSLATARSDTSAAGVRSMSDLGFRPVLLDFYEELLRDDDLQKFRRNVEPRYMPATLERLLSASDSETRRAALTALGFLGSYDQNARVAGLLADEDPFVRDLAMRVLWIIWYRADTPANNAQLARVRQLIATEQLEQAVELSTRLIERAPEFAEAWNQRAIANFFLRRFEESSADCKRALHLNPYHVGALGGLAQCQVMLGRPAEAIRTYRRAIKLEPFNEALRENVNALETEGR